MSESHFQNIGDITVTEHDGTASVLWNIFNFESFIGDKSTLRIGLSKPFQCLNRTWHLQFSTQSKFSKEYYQVKVLDAKNVSSTTEDFHFTVGINNTDDSLFKYLVYNLEVKAFILPVRDVIDKYFTTHVVEFHPKDDNSTPKTKECCLGDLSSELTVDVGGWEFQVNRAIFKSASPVFTHMIEQRERRGSGDSLCISDCEADDFQEFLYCLHVGNAEVLSTENVYKIYSIAKKYEVDWMKTCAIDYIKNNLSVDLFYDIILPASNQSDQELLEVLKEYFKENRMEIIRNPKWELFVVKNAKFAKELLLFKNSNQTM